LVLLSVVSYQLSVICCQLSVVSYQLSVICYQLSVISNQLSVISYLLSVISYQLSVISNNITCKISFSTLQIFLILLLKTNFQLTLISCLNTHISILTSPISLLILIAKTLQIVFPVSPIWDYFNKHF
jgi:hypothetical protein